jgi:AAA+ ATPase superfamily predicted ATPase
VLEIARNSQKAELVAVYGRRRVGKTFLVKQFFGNKFDFYTTGIYEGTKAEQLKFFNKQLCDYSSVPYPLADNWFDAFDQLRHYLSNFAESRPVIVFIDELPWLDTPRSRFIKAFELFWNSWGADRPNLKLIVCGSATTWMMSHVIGDKGGLHNRVTRRIKLSPFNLHETEAFLKSKGIVWNRHQMAEAYMIFGGTPYYLEMLQKSYGLPQNVDRLFFSENAELRDEYNFLFRSLFKNSQIYRNTVELLSKKAKGLSRKELMTGLKLEDGGAFTTVLENLCACDFIRRYTSFGKSERDVLYQLTDMFTLFYLRFVQGGDGRDEHLWSNTIDSPQKRSWSGYSFEQLCLHHIPQIKATLGISGIQSDVCSWFCLPDEGHKGAQIDLIIDRRDQVINLCEMKYATGEYEITGKYEREMQERRELFRSVTHTRKALHLTMVTTYGVKQNASSGSIQSEVKLDDLFRETL